MNLVDVLAQHIPGITTTYWDGIEEKVASSSICASYCPACAQRRWQEHVDEQLDEFFGAFLSAYNYQKALEPLRKLGERLREELGMEVE